MTNNRKLFDKKVKRISKDCFCLEVANQDENCVQHEIRSCCYTMLTQRASLRVYSTLKFKGRQIN